MALKKDIMQDDGVTTNYHRILFVYSYVNSHISIGVLSYVNQEGRDREHTAETPSYKRSVSYELPYSENFTIKDAYEFLKTIDIFEDAEDV